MNTMNCAEVRDWIPGVAAESVEAAARDRVEAHCSGCTECQAELALARLVRAAAPVVPEGLATRVKDAVHYDRRTVRRPWWGLSAAAVAALALGIGMSTDRGNEPVDAVPAYAYEREQGDLWVSDDGLLAGAPLLEGLSEEELTQLLEALGAGGAG